MDLRFNVDTVRKEVSKWENLKGGNLTVFTHIDFQSLWEHISQLWAVRCYLPLDTVNMPTLTPAKQASTTGTRFTYPRVMEGWVDLSGWFKCLQTIHAK